MEAEKAKDKTLENEKRQLRGKDAKQNIPSIAPGMWSWGPVIKHFNANVF